MMPTREQSASHSSMLWVVIMMDRPGAAALIESHVGVPTVLADPFGSGSAIKADKLVARYGPSMIKAAGLAVRGAR